MSLVAATSDLPIDSNYSARPTSLCPKSAKVGRAEVGVWPHTAANREEISITKAKNDRSMQDTPLREELEVLAAARGRARLPMTTLVSQSTGADIFRVCL
jgi:hypothetical protein